MAIRFVKGGVITGIFFLLLIAAILYLFIKTSIPSGIARCGNFSSQFEAQLAYDNNKLKYKVMDADHDQKVCESYPY